MIEILKNGVVVRQIRHVLNASLCDKLDGTLTFDFTVLQEKQIPIFPGMTIRYNGQYYSIVRVSLGFSEGLEISAVSCEHISYSLNDEKYNLVTFVFEGAPKNGLIQLLNGTPFLVGTVEPSTSVECAFTEDSPLNRRSALLRFADACGGELEFDGYSVNLRNHRGSSECISLMDGTNVTSLSAVYDLRKSTQAYEIQLFKHTNISVGDEVRIVYKPLSIDVNTRIVGITYNPFNRYTVRVEVGDYVPNLLSAETERIENIRQEFRAANGKLESRIESTDSSLSELSQTISGFDFRIQNAENAATEMSLKVNGFDVRITDAQNNVSSLSQTVNGFDFRISTTEGSVSEMSQKIDGFSVTLENTEGKISEFSQSLDGISTKITNNEGNISSLSQTVGGISTKVSTAEGKISSLTQTMSGISTKVTNDEKSISTIEQNVKSITTRVSTAEGNITKVTQTADKINWLVKSGTSSSNFTLTDRAVSLAASSIDLSGYVTVTNLKTAGKTTIDAGNITTGTIDATKVTVNNLQINNVKYGTYPIITCSGSYANPVVAVGRDQGSNNIFPNKLTIYGTTINIGDETSSLYTTNIKSGTVNITGGSAVKLVCNSINIGTSNYYAVMNSNREFRPNTYNTSYKFYLGSSSYPWYYGFITELTVLSSAKLGTSTGAKVGFFGAAPVARKSVSKASSSTASAAVTAVNNLITALKGYGLIY